jgi:hypothetical protein
VQVAAENLAKPFDRLVIDLRQRLQTSLVILGVRELGQHGLHPGAQTNELGRVQHIWLWLG